MVWEKNEFENCNLKHSRSTLLGLLPTFLRISTKQRLLPGYICKIPRCNCPVRKFSARCELGLTQLTLNGEKMTKI